MASRLLLFVLFCLLFGSMSPLFAGEGFSVEKLRCEYLVNPLGIGQTLPRLSWVLESTVRGDQQAAYQVIVASTPELLAAGSGDLWDSGKVQSDQSVLVTYAGKPLLSRMRCFWKVRVWSALGGDGVWSDPASWSVGLLSPADWKAKWIDGAPPAATTQPVGAVDYYRKSFVAKPAVQNATLYVTALGVYEAHLNGRRVGDHVLAPDWTDYNKRIRYQAYDVTRMVHPGRNVLGAELANGWYAGHLGNGGFQEYGKTPALLAQLEITYADGTTDLITTDGSWKTHPSDILSSDFMLGEQCDARQAIEGWDEPGLDDTSWQQARVRDEPARPLESQVSPPVRETGLIKPIKLTEPAPGKWTFDLGQNMVGVVRLKVTAPAGTIITLHHAEVLNSDGTIYTANLRKAPSLDVYTCRGGCRGDLPLDHLPRLR